MNALPLPRGAQARAAYQALREHGVEGSLAAVATQALMAETTVAGRYNVLARLPEVPFSAYASICSAMQGAA